MNNSVDNSLFACKCLNIRIRPQPPPAGSLAPTLDNAPEYKPVYVGDGGITLSHPQLTLRTQSSGGPLKDTSRCTRSVTLTCLMCQTIVYRVQHNIPIDTAGKDGARLPTDDWAEKEILKSVSGWIECHNGCLTGNDIADALKSPSYSTTFSVIVPAPSNSSPVEDLSHKYPIYVATSPPPPEPLTHHLPFLRPIFPPPPFTPSHPVFAHLSSLASTRSEALRKEAECHITELVNQKVGEIEKAEAELKAEVEAIWRGFKAGVTEVEQRTAPSARKSNIRRTSGNWKDEREASNSKGAIPLVSVREFNPVGSPRRVASPISKPKPSTLSASLATSTFHHPRALAEEGRNGSSTSPPNHSVNGSSPLSGSSYSSLSSRSPASLAVRAAGDYADGTYITPFKRNMNQGNDTATSFRYFTIQEADVARKHGKVNGSSEVSGDKEAKTGSLATAGNVAQPESSKAVSSTKPHKTTDDDDVSVAPKQDEGLRGKRKVTFDVQPDVVTIKREVKSEDKEEETQAAGRAAEEMIFDLEDESNERSSAEEVRLPLNEPPVAPVRPIRNRAAGPGLPSSLSALRPSSLPAPSHVRPTRHFTPSNDVVSQSLSPTREFVKRVTPPQPDSDDSSELDNQEAEIMKLVAANTPSHRGAWKKDSKAWQMFVNRKGGTGRVQIREENEDDTPAEDEESDGDSGSSDAQKEWARYVSPNLAASLPYQMREPAPVQLKETVLSLASYQPKSEHAKPVEDSVAPPETQKNMSSAAWRKATYAERDLTRAMDPGALDFAPEEDDEFDGDAAVVGSLGQGERGRLRALRIMQGGLSTPASGMWRSLA